MRILAAGGGSGGHVTPVVAVLHEIRQARPDVEVRFWCDKGFEAQSKTIMTEYDPGIRVDTIISGKLRRYNKLPLLEQLMRVRTIVWPNIRDGFKVTAGIVQSFFKLIAWRPDVVFAKGGFVCLPVGIAARLLRIPLIIHDSDAHPGLTNRLLSRWATQILTGAPLEYYKYPASKTHYVGIPINVDLADPTMSAEERKKQLDINPNKPLVFCTGGGLGAARINEAVIANLETLLPHTSVVIVTGQKNYQETVDKTPKDTLQRDDLKIYPFLSGLAEHFAAADVVITRAGMTTMYELAALGRPTIVIPNAHLTGGHQIKNASVYSDAGAAIVLDEDELVENPAILAENVIRLVSHPELKQQLSDSILKLAKPDAAKETAKIILQAVSDEKKG